MLTINRLQAIALYDFLKNQWIEDYTVRNLVDELQRYITTSDKKAIQEISEEDKVRNAYNRIEKQLSRPTYNKR